MQAETQLATVEVGEQVIEVSPWIEAEQKTEFIAGFDAVLGEGFTAWNSYVAVKFGVMLLPAGRLLGAPAVPKFTPPELSIETRLPSTPSSK